MPDEEELAAFYPDQYWWRSSDKVENSALKKLESVYRRLALRGHLSFILRAAENRPNPAVLDIGCGSGTLLGLLKERGFRPTGVDFSPEAARIARQENGVRVVVGSLDQAGFPNDSFDIVTLFHVMEHVTDPRNLLAEASRILKPDGALIVQVPNIDSWQFRAFGPRWYGLDIPRHVIDYSQQAMLRLLDASGFAARRIKHFNLRDNAPALVSSLLPSLDPISRQIRSAKRGVRETPAAASLRHALYFGLVVGAYPFVLLEAAFGHGATVMIEARKL
jgi:SAM-dependent methyltransferase